MVNFVVIPAICLAWFDLAPIKRILLFAIAPTVLFGCLANAGRWFEFPTFGPFGPSSRLTQIYDFHWIAPLLTVALASGLWAIRIQRGWRITRLACEKTQPSFPAKMPELVALVSWIMVAAGLSYFWIIRNANNQFDLSNITIPFVLLFAGGIIALLPMTYLIMKTRWPLVKGLSILAVFPAIVLAIVLATFLGVGLSDYRQTGILIPDQAITIAAMCFATLLYPVVFLWGLRLIGFQLVIPKRQRKHQKSPSESVPHPLDD